MLVLLLLTKPLKVVQFAVARLVVCCKTYPADGHRHEMTKCLTVFVTTTGVLRPS